MKVTVLGRSPVVKVLWQGFKALNLLIFSEFRDYYVRTRLRTKLNTIINI